jgi:tetratricopeptide (TPR) repeat protein
MAMSGCQESSTPVLEQDAVDAYVRGRSLAERGQLDEALAELARAIDTDPNLGSAHAAMGDIYRRTEQPELAAAAYERACQTNPYSFRYHYNLGVVRQQLAAAAETVGELRDQLLAAAEVYLRAITLKPDDFDANLNLSVCYYQLRQYNKAEQYCREALAVEPGNHHAHTNLGAILNQLGRPHEAIRQYRTSLELNARQPRVLVNLGSSYIQLQQWPNAVNAYQLAADMDPRSATPLERLGYCYFYQGDYASAERFYQAALTLEPDFAEAYRGLGIVYMTRFLLDGSDPSLRRRALEAWNRSLELNPNQPQLQELLRKYTPAPARPVL